MATTLFIYLMVFNATLNKISIILWRSVLLVGETGSPGENHQTGKSLCDATEKQEDMEECVHRIWMFSTSN